MAKRIFMQIGINMSGAGNSSSSAVVADTFSTPVVTSRSDAVRSEALKANGRNAGKAGGSLASYGATGTLSGSSFGGNDAATSRGYKEMLDAIKKLYDNADKLQERVCQLQFKYAETFFKGAALFSPATSNIILGLTGKDNPNEVKDLPDPMEAHFTRDDVDKNFESLNKSLETQDPPQNVSS